MINQPDGLIRPQNPEPMDAGVRLDQLREGNTPNRALQDLEIASGIFDRMGKGWSGDEIDAGIEHFMSAMSMLTQEEIRELAHNSVGDPMVAIRKKLQVMAGPVEVAQDASIPETKKGSSIQEALQSLQIVRDISSKGILVVAENASLIIKNIQVITKVLEENDLKELSEMLTGTSTEMLDEIEARLKALA